MHPDQFRQSLESLEQAKPALALWRLRDFERGWRNLVHLGEALGPEALGPLFEALTRILPRCPDPDMALNNLERFLANPDGKRQLPGLLEEARFRTLETMLQLFSTSQYCSDLLVTNPDHLDMLQVPLRRSPSPKEMVDQLQQEVSAAFEDSAVLRAFRRFRQRQILRIGANDIFRDRPLEEVTRDISRVADAALEVALASAIGHVGKRLGQPFTAAGPPARCVVLAFGKHGGEELNYSSDIDLMFVYDEEGSTRGKRINSVGNDEFFGRVVTEVVRLLTTHTDRGQAYRVDLRLRPEGLRGPLARSVASTLSYYDTLGRTWERQALIKVRPVAGDLKLGEQFLQAIEPFVYRKYLSFAEINEIKALKRRIEHKARSAAVATQAGRQAAGNDFSPDWGEVKTGHGGIRDVEFTIQFLQLLNGGDLPAVRQRNTLLAMQALERVGCLTDQEFNFLEQGYRFLRKTEHRLQLLFDLQTHKLPESEEELAKLALRMGYPHSTERRSGADSEPPAEGDSGIFFPPSPPPARPALEAFLKDYRDKTDLNRKILDHLLHQTFQGTDGQAEPESDLILDPNPDAETIKSVLGRYPFKDVQGAYHNLTLLAQESVPFLSTRRCRHFLASIAPRLLRALAEAPDPDMALVNLEKVTASLGAKAVLWELFSFNSPSLKLYVDVCAWSQFLSQILINNPGMIDDLLDSLLLNQPRTLDELQAELAELCKGAAEPDPILHSFQDKELLRIGVRDILGKDTIQETTAALSDLAEAILCRVAALQEPGMTKRFGVPYLGDGLSSGAASATPPAAASRYVLLALGKLGGREMTYHSDLDLILVYEGDGRTGPPPGASRFDRFDLTDNFHYFTELGQRIIKATSLLGPLGRLYEVDMRLRPTGKSGSLVIPLTAFRRYYGCAPEGAAAREGEAAAEPKAADASSLAEGHAQLWERQALTRARVVHGDPDFGREVMRAAHEAAYGLPWRPVLADEIHDMRERLEATRGERHLKRGRGGIVDIEFLVQMLKIKYAGQRAELRTTNTWEALDGLRDVGLLSDDEHAALRDSYDFLRTVEARLRIVHNLALNELPAAVEDLEKLARRLGYEPDGPHPAHPRLQADLERHTRQTRELYLRVLEREKR